MVRIGDDELHPREAAGNEPAEEGGPVGSVLRGADVTAKNLASAIGVDARGDDHGHLDDPPLLADALREGVHPDVAIRTGIERALQEGADLPVQLGADAGYLARRDALAAQGADEVIDAAGGDALHVGRLHDGVQGPL